MLKTHSVVIPLQNQSRFLVDEVMGQLLGWIRVKVRGRVRARARDAVTLGPGMQSH